MNLILEKFPVEGPYWFSKNSWNEQRNKGKHRAVDIFGRRINAIVTPISGTVVEVTIESDNTKGGNSCIIAVKGYKNLYCYMCHMNDIFISEGREVNVGDMVGTMGKSGNAKSTRCHLHIQFYKLFGRNNSKKSFVNPTKELLRLADPDLKTRSKCNKNPETCEWCNQ